MHINVTIASVRRVQGTSDKTGNAYDFDSIMALVDGLDPIELNVSGDLRPAGGFARGQNVDMEISFRPGTKADFVRLAPAVVSAGKAS